MDTKQVQSNIFTGGLNTDLHPLTTPNTILTDCVNGTIITYNGNEYILQNDMGNYQLKTAQLPADYIPIGVKEYGSIIYIVSYNPIDKKCQIGSYPSPQTLFGDDGKESRDDYYSGIKINTLSSNWTWSENGNSLEGVNNGDNKNDKTVLFSNYKPQQNLIILFPQEGDLQDTYLNPGDKYWLYKEPVNNEEVWKFQKITYHVLNESKEVYELSDDLVEEQMIETISTEQMPYVKWEIPGWLGYKPSVLEPTSFNLYLTDINIPAFKVNNIGDTEIIFSMQGQITFDKDEVWNKYYKNLKVFFEYNYKNEWISTKWGPNSDKDGHITSEEVNTTPTNYGNKINVLTFNISGRIKVSENDVIQIRATPYIIDDEGGQGQGIVYDNLVNVSSINISDLYDIESIKVFDTYKYLVDSTGVTINMSIISPTSKLSNITCLYKIYSINEGFSDVKDIFNTYRSIDSLNLMGQNVFTLDFEGEFQKENVYILEISFFEDNNTVSPIYQQAQFLITSEVMNDFYSTRNQYHKISLPEWSSKLKNYINIEKDINLASLGGNLTRYDKYIRTYTIDSLFKSDFYKTAENDEIEGGDSAFMGDLSDSVSSIVTKITNSKDLSTSAYYGCSQTLINRIIYELKAPNILNNTGLWENAEWTNSTSSNVTSVNNGIRNEETNDYHEYDISTSNPAYDNSVSLIYTSAQLGSYNANSYTGRNGTKWYMYRNLILNFSTGLDEEWNIAKIAIKNWAGWNSNITRDGITESRLDALYRKSILGLGRVGRPAYQGYALTSFSHDKDIVWNVRNGSQFNYWSLSSVGDTSSLDTSKLDTTGEALNFDDWVTKNSYPWTFIAMVFSSGNPYSSQNTTVQRGWHFPDNTIRAYNSLSELSAGIAISCSDGSAKSIAVIRFFPETYSKGFLGYLHSPHNESLGRDTHTRWMVSTDNPLATVPTITNLNWSDSVPQKMNECVGALLFGLGVHLYGYTDIKDEDKWCISYSGNNISVSSSRDYILKYTRQDRLKSLRYKNVDLVKTPLPDGTLLNLFNIIKNKDKVAIDNLKGAFNTDTIITKLNPYTHTINPNFEDISNKFATFTSNLSSSLLTYISEWTDTKNSSYNKVYCDLVTGTRLDRMLSTIADSLEFEYTNYEGKFYYRGLPEMIINPLVEGNRQIGGVRGLDLSTVIVWDDVYKLLTPTEAFLETENLK